MEEKINPIEEAVEVKEEIAGEKPNVDIMEKLRPHKRKILGGILGGLFFAGLIFSVLKLGETRQAQLSPRPSSTPTVVEENCGGMSLSDAKEIALESECVEEGTLKDEYFCNESTGTWWLDLDIEKSGCAPACVVDVSTGEAEINWRCTGLVPSEDRVYCEDPRSQFCTMECIVNPPYICGSDGRSYCSICQACANSEVEWYEMQDEPCEQGEVGSEEEYVCPEPGVLDCMPGGWRPELKYCTSEYSSWIQQHCPDVSIAW